MSHKKRYHEFSFTCGCKSCRAAVRRFEADLPASMEDPDDRAPEFTTCAEVLDAWREQVLIERKLQDAYGCEPYHAALSREFWLDRSKETAQRLSELRSQMYDAGYSDDFMGSEYVRIEETYNDSRLDDRPSE